MDRRSLFRTVAATGLPCLVVGTARGATETIRLVQFEGIACNPDWFGRDRDPILALAPKNGG
ncbi:hypothetical protein HN018_05400 [Lichenicola cladoniae]|uniref:Uncharacterized protein n=1 Tax=Lichenicola cladoniae TaxID=1484109 RepID=A0A6M8HMI6_9PROT|nr:hypothetical protein [Lichenicola cladoniae]NPD67007.1 hypothetical protein [Acetobacteraceae bacterium]QKE89555.1 hypothetical protein HN018_05400 [Lichenicola cladoniae]